MILALGNFWNAYKGPEDYVAWAAAAAGGNNGSWTGTVMDFYR